MPFSHYLGSAGTPLPSSPRVFSTRRRQLGLVSSLAIALAGVAFLAYAQAGDLYPHQFHSGTAKVYYFEDFRNYNLNPPMGVVEGVRLGNDPIWKQRAEANVDLKKPGLIFQSDVPLSPITPKLKNYDVLFQFRLQAKKDGTVGGFALQMGIEANAKAGHLLVTISPNDVKLSSEGITPAITGGGALPFEIEKNRWQECTVTVRDGVVTVYLDDNRVLKPVAEGKMPGGATFQGINFQGFAATPFSVSEIVVRDPAPLPDHAITQILPAPRKVEASAFTAGASKTVPVNDSFGGTLRVGAGSGETSVSLDWADGHQDKLTFQTAGITEQRTTKVDGKPVQEKIERPDAMIKIKGLAEKKALDFYVRPMLRHYATPSIFPDVYFDLTRDWDLLPKASEHPLKVEARRTSTGVDLYLDSSYAGSLAGEEIKGMTFTLAPEASLGPVFSDQLPKEAKGSSQKYLPLDVAAQGMAKSFAGATSSLPAGLAEVKGVPMIVAAGEGSADVGLVRQGQDDWALGEDEYLNRSPFEGFLSEVHFAVPGGVLYTKAWVLVAVDPDEEKDPVLTARLAYYPLRSGTGGNLLADTTIALPRKGEKPGEGIIPVGTITKPSKDGKPVEVPLYLVEVPLNTGKILDVSMEQPVLNFEFIGKPWENFQQRDKTMKPDPRSTSAVQIFGVTLEKSPVSLAFAQSQPGNIFHNEEKPETTAILTSSAPAKGKLAWEIMNADGQKVGGGTKDYQFAKAGEEQKVLLPLNVPELGWYRLLVRLEDEKGKTVLTHPASFARLGQDERKAKYDSRYGVWWWDGTHGTPKDKEFSGPILFKAGIRKMTWSKATEKELERWSITKDQIGTPGRFAGLNEPEKVAQMTEAELQKAVEDYPHLREAMIFHESGPDNDLPLELFGIKPNQDEEQIVKETRYATMLNLIGGVIREKFPQLRTVVGNSNSSQTTLAAALRNGGKVEYIDSIGLETAAQTHVPEKLQEYALQGFQITKETVKILTGRDIPVTGSVEFTYRTDRELGQRKQAQWYMRDILVCLANDFSRIGPGTLFDVNTPYYETPWGASGYLERAPYGYPKEAYVAYATLTNALDQVTSPRQIPTGSTTVYAVEFDRPDKKKAAALWASRGEAEYHLEFDGEASVRITEMDGKTREEKTKDGKLVVKAGTSPVYTRTDKPIKAITLGQRTFPKDEARAKLATVAAPLEKVEEVEIDPDNSLDVPLVSPVRMPVWKHGAFDLRQAQDEEKGACLELELKTDENADQSKYITEYTTLRLKEPMPVSGEPAALGVWVKGNSNWGRVMFEIEDAQGEVWRSISTGGWGCDILDWPGNSAVNFDGWNFVALPLRDSTLFHEPSPGLVLEQWVTNGGNKKIDFPIKIRGLIVEMNRTSIDLTDFKASKPVIRLKDVSGIYDL